MSTGKSYQWSDYALIGLAVVVYLVLIVLVYVKFMQTTACKGRCGHCDDCCDKDEEKGLIKSKEESEGWFETLSELDKIQLNLKNNRKFTTYERIVMFFSK